MAVVDTGVLLDHPDLQGRLVAGYDFISDPLSANDGDGIDDDPDDPGDSTIGNSSFHGTHTAGIIAATTNNAFGVAGSTWNCKVMPIRTLGIFGGTVADEVEGMLFAGGLPNASGTVPEELAQVINLGLGGSAGQAESAIERAAIQDLVQIGVTVIAAAGNQGSSLPAPPASYPETISVGAINASFERAIYSNYGSTLDIMGPGGRISRDDNEDGIPDGIFSTGGDDSSGKIVPVFGFLEGTSMACAHVSGVAALMLSVHAELTPAQTRALLRTTAEDLGIPGQDDMFGFGLVDAAAAVVAAACSACVQDIDLSGDVRVPDLIKLLGCWGPLKGDPVCACLDIDTSGDIGVPDLIALLAKWGVCPS